MTITHLRRSYDTPSRRWIELKCNKLDEMGRVRISSSARSATDRRPPHCPTTAPLSCVSVEKKPVRRDRWPRCADTTQDSRFGVVCGADDDDMCFTLVRQLDDAKKINSYPCLRRLWSLPPRAPLLSVCACGGGCVFVRARWRCAAVVVRRWTEAVSAKGADYLVPQPALQCRESVRDV